MQLKSKIEQHQYIVSNEKVLAINLPQVSDRQCHFILGIRKSGSTLLNKIVMDLCRHHQVPTLSIADRAFEQNIPFKDWQNCNELNDIIKDGLFYLGFRSLPLFLTKNELFKNRKKILLVRDPRDAIVSEFFSVAYNHSVPKANDSNKNGAREELLRRREESQLQGIDEYVLKNAYSLNKTITDYIKCLEFEDPNLQIYRYEDVITNKKIWIQEIAQFLNLPLTESLLNDMLIRYDVIPNQEASKKFIRKAIPGDYKEKLQLETIEQINSIFQDVLTKFYSR